MPASNFLEQLPIEFFLCGYKVRISRADGLIRMGISDKPIAVSTRKDWERLAISASPNRIREFLTFYLKTPVGPNVLTFGPFSDINRRRCHIVTLTLAAWRSRNGPKDKAGRLKKAMRCSSYYMNDPVFADSTCVKKTKDASGLCSLHNRPDAKTLWNHDPFAEMDGLRTVVNNNQQQQAEEEAYRAGEWERKWHPISSTIHHTATNRQICYLLELGERPERLSGITKEEASRRIDAIVEASASDN